MSNTYGMSNPFIVQNGLIVNADAVITGSISSSTATINRLVVRDVTTAYMDAKLQQTFHHTPLLIILRGL